MMIPANDPVAKVALQEIVELYHMTDADDQRNERVLSGADVVDELSIWIQRNHELLRKLGIVQDDLHSG